MAIPKSRIDVWSPHMKQVDADVTGGAGTPPAYETLTPARWVTLETPANLLTNQRRANALSSLSITDSLYNPRKASMTITNKCNDYRSLYDNTDSSTVTATTYTHVYNDSDGNDAAGGARQLPRNWGLYTNFFYPFQYIRVVDTQTNLVLFSGRIYKIDKRYENSRGSVIVLECRDSLEELNILSTKSLVKNVEFATTDNGVNMRKSHYMMFALKLAFDYHAANVKPSGGPGKSQTSPLVGTNLANTYNMTNYDNANDAASTNANSYSRFELSETEVGRPTTWRLEETGSKSLLSEMIRFAMSEPHEDETADDQFGYDFFVDSNIGSSNLSATVAPPAEHFNYFKRGRRLAKPQGSSSTQDPATYGLTIHFPTGKSEIAQGHKTDGDPSVAQVAKKVMHRAFDFDNPNDEMFTEGILTYNAIDDSGEDGAAASDKHPVVKIKKFEIIWVHHLSGQLTYKGKNIDDEWKKDTADTPGVDSAEVIAAYNQAGQLQAGSVARVQYQSNIGNSSPTADFHYLMLSDISEIEGGGTFPLTNYGSDDYVIFQTQRASGPQVTFSFNANERHNPQEGRPSMVWNITKVFNMTQMNITHPDDLRTVMASRLAQSSYEIRRGTYQVTKAPYYWYDAQVHSQSGLSAGQRVTVKNLNGSSALNITEFGFREGMLVHKMNSDFSAIEQANSKDVYGYCFNMTSDTSMDIDLTESQSFSNDDNIRLFIPIRAGDVIRVDNTLADIFGDHIITEMEYNEFMGPVTQIKSIGANEGRRSGPVAKRTLATALNSEPIMERINPNFGSSKGNQFADFSGDVTYPLANRIDWTAGNLTTLDGTSYQIVASNTSDATHGLGGSGMAGTYVYQLYVDPDGENPATNSYHIKTKLKSAYTQDADNIALMTAQATNSLPSVTSGAVHTNGDGSAYPVDAELVTHPSSVPSVLLKKGAQYWSTDLKFEGTDYNIVRWGHKDNIANNATISFGDDVTEAIANNPATTFAVGTSWIYKIVGPSPDGTLVVTQIYSDVTRADTDRILVATVVVVGDVGQGSPTILPLNGNSTTISVGSFAARSILATDIKTGSITTAELNFFPATNDADKTAGTVGGWSLNSGQIYSGTPDTSGYTSTNGHITINSAGSIHTPKFFVNTDGTAGFKGTLTIGSTDLTETNTVNANTTKGDVGLGTSQAEAQAGLIAGTTITGGGITMSGGGVIKTTGFTHNGSVPTSSSNGFFLGHDGASAYDFVIGNTTNSIAWDGSLGVFTVTGTVVTKGNVGLSNLENDNFASNGDIDDGKIGGLDVTATTLKVGTGNINNADTAFYVNNSGHFSLKNTFYWNGTTLAITGNATFSGALSAATGTFHGDISAASGTFTGNVSAASGGAVLGSEGLVITAGTDSTSFLNFKTSGGQTNLKVYASGDDVTLNNQTTSGDIKLAAAGAIVISALSMIPTGVYKLGTADDYWGWLYAENVYANNLVGRTGSTINVYDPLRAISGSDAAPSYSFISGTNSGLKYYTSGSYDGVSLIGNGRKIATAMSASSSLRYLWMEAHIDMNDWSLLDVGVIRCTDGGTVLAPTFSWMTNTDSGIYYSSGVYISVGNSTKFGASSSINYNYQKVYVSSMDSTSGGVYVKWESGMLKQQSSTERAKMNIRDLDIDSSKIYDLAMKSFEFRTPVRDETDHSVVDDNGRLTYTDVPESTSFGLIAEAVNELVPELVLSAADDGIPDAVDYPLLSVLVLAELKKLRARIEVLEGN